MNIETFRKFFYYNYTFEFLMKHSNDKLNLSLDATPGNFYDLIALCDIDYDIADIFKENKITHIPSLLLYGGYINSALMFWVTCARTHQYNECDENNYFEYQNDESYIKSHLSEDIIKILKGGINVYIESLRKKINRSIAEDRTISLYDKLTNQLE